MMGGVGVPRKASSRNIAAEKTLRIYLDGRSGRERFLAIPRERETVNIDHIKRGYYSIKALNPTGIVPVGPALPTTLTA